MPESTSFSLSSMGRVVWVFVVSLVVVSAHSYRGLNPKREMGKALLRQRMGLLSKMGRFK